MDDFNVDRELKRELVAEAVAARAGYASVDEFLDAVDIDLVPNEQGPYWHARVRLPDWTRSP